MFCSWRAKKVERTRCVEGEVGILKITAAAQAERASVAVLTAEAEVAEMRGVVAHMV